MSSSSRHKSKYDNRIQNKRHANKYRYKQDLGEETRYIEFKKGGGDIQKEFIITGHEKCLAHYACAFMNNMEGGTIYLGVNDEGFKFTQIAKEYKKIYANRVHNKRPLNVYLNDENIGDETRQREFKEGSIDNFLRTANTKSLAHYACGFVNIQKDGTIFIGVDDHGKVKGVKFDHGKRDNIRTQISRIMKYDIEPPLSTVHYSISFAPVRTIKGEDQEDMYVLEINIYAVDNLTQLYKVDGEVMKPTHSFAAVGLLIVAVLTGGILPCPTSCLCKTTINGTNVDCFLKGLKSIPRNFPNDTMDM
ncbi:Hypothetical predicted protein [Mytilus galloprovincialis]|uniref:Schlafen AlbA-2 domain-containing protein n=1 Tax=Mytilus galloprovincialis TaxID=29158 RepID=A0A8B6DDA1_MYTGA|nr:Hypothetical predicted protein [Mytilus galloprovincialis]